jgi:hypothetical protein
MRKVVVVALMAKSNGDSQSANDSYIWYYPLAPLITLFALNTITDSEVVCFCFFLVANRFKVLLQLLFFLHD